MSPRSFAVVAALALLLAGAAPTAGLDSGVQGPGGPVDGSQANQAALTPHNTSLEPGDVEMRIELESDGDAHWRVMTAVAVRDGDEREAFADLVDQFNRSDSPLGLAAFEATAENVSRATGRTMTIENVERHHALHNETGALWITFTWTNFGRTVGDRISVDDGFNTTSGVWLPSLSEEESLVVVPPAGYGVSSAPTGSNAAPTSLSDGVARWEGPRDFEQRGPWIVYSGDTGTRPRLTITTSPSGPTNGTTTGGGIPGTTAPGSGEGDGFPAALPLIVVLAAVGALVLVAYTRRDEDGSGLGDIIGGADDGDDGSSAASDADASSEEAPASADSAENDGTVPEEGSASSAGAGETAATGAAAGAAAEVGSDSEQADDAAASADDGIDEELLSDEERVERLIERNGGRMKQAAIVQETGWSNAKVSQLLSAMDDDGRIDKLRIGRENLISFPDEDVADLDSE